MPTICAVPQLTVIDDEIDITVDGLESNKAVTVSASIVYYKILYVGFGHFYSDSTGCVNLKREISYGGTYKGLQPMGLFSSMRAMLSKHGCPRLLVKGSAEEILKYRISVWKGHLSRDQIHQLHIKYAPLGTGNQFNEFFQKYAICQYDIQRTYLSPNVRRIPIKVNFRDETICGVLFLPKGKGPFPGVIDMFGGAGGCVEIRAALLAKHGFASLALAYFAYEGLKAKTYAEFEMVYFDRTIEWFSQHPMVAPGGVSMVGICLGAQMALISAIRNANVRSSICINSNMFMSARSSDDNLIIDYLSSMALSKKNISEIWNGVMSSNFANQPIVPRSKLQYSHDNPILFLVGEYDPYPKCVDDTIDQLKQSGKKSIFKKVIYGQGHLIEPPYMPLCVASPSPSNVGDNDEYSQLIDSLPYDWSGDYENHGKSQIEAWKVLLDFLTKHSAHSAISKL